MRIKWMLLSDETKYVTEVFMYSYLPYLTVPDTTRYAHIAQCQKLNASWLGADPHQKSEAPWDLESGVQQSMNSQTSLQLMLNGICASKIRESKGCLPNPFEEHLLFQLLLCTSFNSAPEVASRQRPPETRTSTSLCLPAALTTAFQGKERVRPSDSYLGRGEQPVGSRREVIPRHGEHRTSAGPGTQP
jgi:hypothetical protein